MLGQAAVFWIVFLFVIPPVLAAAERAVGVPSLVFDGQRAVAVVLFVAASVLNLASGFALALVGKGTPLPLDQPRRLVVRGPYRCVRNPMAVGGLSQGLAVGLWLGAWSVFAYVVAGGLLWHVFVRPIEEADLAARFGSRYEAYRRRVRCWIPGWLLVG